MSPVDTEPFIHAGFKAFFILRPLSAKPSAYDCLRGQYMSVLEHDIPERFFNDPNQCNATGTMTPIAGLPMCLQGIGSVKALGFLAAQAGQIDS